jgi:hypothetical protein
MRLLEYLYEKRFDSNFPSPSERGRMGGGACLSRGAGCGGQRLQVEACSKYPLAEQGRRAMGWSIMFQEAVSFL